MTMKITKTAPAPIGKATNQKKLIYFDQVEFNKRTEAYKSAVKLEGEILQELNRFLPTKLKELNNYKDALNVLYTAIADTPANTLGISGEVIADLQRLDLTKLKELVLKYEPTHPPAISDFSVYATTPEQIERLEAFTGIFKAYQKLCELDTNLKPFALATLLPYRCRVDHTTQTIRPSTEWTLSGTYRILG